MAKIEVAEVKTYRCSDGSIFDSKAVAEAHEADLKDPNYLLIKRIDELEKKIKGKILSKKKNKKLNFCKILSKKFEIFC